MKLFITGATGFLGKKIITQITNSFEVIYILTRNKIPDEFKHLPNLKIVKGDITNINVIEDPLLLEEITSSVTHVLHAAAFYNLKAEHKICYEHNVYGTKNVIDLAKKIKNMHSFSYISTIAVAGHSSLNLNEAPLKNPPKFGDHYSSTKYLAEKLVFESFQSKQLILNVIRPGIIVGDSITGVTDKVDGPYYFVELFKKIAFLSKINKIPLILPLPHNPNALIPIIPVDHCAQAIAKIITSSQFKESGIYHLISKETPTIRQFLADINDRFNLNIRYISMNRHFAYDFLLSRLGIPTEVVPFMFSQTIYEMGATLALIPELNSSSYFNYKDSIFK